MTDETALSSLIYPNADRLPVILNYVLISASAGNITEQDLLQTLLRNYNTNVRPARDPSESVEVAIGVAMKQIVDLMSLPRTLNCHDFAVDLLLNGYSASPIPLSLFVCWLQPNANIITHTHTHIYDIISNHVIRIRGTSRIRDSMVVLVAWSHFGW